MAQYNIQDLPDDDTISESRSNMFPTILPPLVSNSEQYGISVPQVIQPQIQANYPQQGPLPQYVQYVPQQPQLPIYPQYVQNQQVVAQPIQNIDEPLIVNPPLIVLKHAVVHKAGPAEQQYFHTRALGQLALTNLFTVIVIAISTQQPIHYFGLTYDIYHGTFKPLFYISIAVFILTTLQTLVNIEKKLKKNHKYILMALWNISYVLIFLGSFASSYRTYQWAYQSEYIVYRARFGDEMLYGLILVVIQLLSIVIALNTQRQISYQKFSVYIIPSAALFELVIYNLTNLYDQPFYWISFISSVLASYYFIFLIQQINKSGLLFYKKQTNYNILAPMLWFSCMLFPFYENEQ